MMIAQKRSVADQHEGAALGFPSTEIRTHSLQSGATIMAMHLNEMKISLSNDDKSSEEILLL